MKTRFWLRNSIEIYIKKREKEDFKTLRENGIK